MERLRFAPLDRALSRVVLGTFPFSESRPDDAFAILDAWLGLGGNVVDTAPAYGDGQAERLIGRYLAATARRADVVVLTKGCHPGPDGRPRVTPEDMRHDLAGSLSRLGTDVVDIYMLHRDDPSMPVAPIVEALNEEAARGRVRSFGASNWSMARMLEANDHAARHGLVGFTSSSCQLSLAQPIEELCPGCVSIHGTSDLEVHARLQLPLFAWASLAGGFLREDGVRDPETLRAYDSPENRERLARADVVARSMGLTRTQVAVAWVLGQAFPAYAILASQRVEHLRQVAAAAGTHLTRDQVAWLDLRRRDRSPARQAAIPTE